MDNITSNNLYYRPLTSKDVTDKYISWLNNRDVNKYLEVRHTKHSREKVIEFISLKNLSENEYLYGVFCQKNNIHIGNVKIGNINHIYRTGEISLFIGDKNYWGRKLGVEIIQALTCHAFTNLGILKLEAGCYESNKASLKSFIACGYSIEGNLRSQVISDGNRENVIRLGILKDEQIS